MSNQQQPTPEYSFGNPPPMGNPMTGAMFGTAAPPPQFLPVRQFRGDSLAQPFNFRERMKRTEPMLGMALGMPSPEGARLLGAMGYDYIFIDWEHTPMGIKEVTDLIRWISLSGEGQTAVVVRVPTHDHIWLTWALDAGASAVVVPHIETVEQAKAVVDHARFWTQGGHRSYAPFAMYLGVNDGDQTGTFPWDIYNRAGVICQLESGLASKNADAIAQVEGVDGFMVGHADLRTDLGLMLANDGEEPEYVEALGKILGAAKKHGNKPVLSFAMGKDMIAKRREQGFRMLMVGADGIIMAQGGRQVLQDAYEAVKSVEDKASSA